MKAQGAKKIANPHNHYFPVGISPVPASEASINA